MPKNRKRKELRRRQVRTVGLVVEGHAEFDALRLLHTEKLVPGCPHLKLRNLGGVGGEVTPRGIAKRVSKKVLGLMVSGVSQVIVVIDRETRNVCPGILAGQVADELDRLLRPKGRSIRDVDIVIADRAFEAWILADAKGLHNRKVFVKAPKFGCFEGKRGVRGKLGKAEIKRLLGRDYSETRDGPWLFQRIEFPVARDFGAGKDGSKSLDKFLRSLGV